MQNVSFKLSQSLMALALVGLVWSAVAPSAEAA